MVNPGAFRGSRREFLMGEKGSYSAGVAGGYAAEALALIQRRYFKRYPVDLPHEQEPRDEDLAAVDDDAADPEIVEPDPEKLSNDEYETAMAQIAKRRELICYRKAQIKRWMAYQHMKDNDLNPKDSGAYNPYNALLAKLTGKPANRPRCKTGVNVWRKSYRDEIEAELRKRLGDLKGKKAQLAAERDKIAREMFSKLDQEEQSHWKGIATDEHEEQMKEYKKELALADVPSTAPEDRQRCIQGLVHFAQPILELICAATGWKASLIAGGPEPANDGQLNVISIHSGTTTGDVKMNFGRAERERYKKYIIPIYGSFLQKCYTPEECRSRALPSDEGFIPISTMDDHVQNENISLFSLEPSVSPPPAAGTKVSPPRVSIAHRPPVTTGTAAVDDMATARAATPLRPPTVDTLAVSEDDSPFPFEFPPSPSLAYSGVPSPLPPHTQPSSSGDILSHSRTPSPTPSRTRSPPPDFTPPPSRAPSPAPSHSRLPPRDLMPCHSQIPSTVLPLSSSQIQSSIRSQQPPPARLPISAPSLSTRSAASRCMTGVTVQATPPHTTGLSTRSMAREATSEVAAVKAAKTSSRKGNKRGTEPFVNEEHAQKRRKISTNVARAVSSSEALSIPVMDQAPDSAPEWFKTTFSMVHSANLGPEWVELIRKWAAFEVRAGYEEVAKLGTLHRPVSVKEWIQRRRSPTWKPPITDLSKYGKEVLQWWTSLQPAWRISSEGNIMFTVLGGDWEMLRRPGVNGLLSVIACLFHWGAALQKNGKRVNHPQWIAVVKDCSTVYTYLLQ